MAPPSTSEFTSPKLPPRTVERWLMPVQRFLHVEAASGSMLLACTVLALLLANSAWSYHFAALWKTPVALSIGQFTLAGDIGHLVITDGLMTIFFFVVGLEIKREIILGELRHPRKALLPVVAACGGAIVPALIYLALQWDQPGQRGWAIPMATDIAFVVGFLALFGPRVPFGLKIFLLTLAIVDDLIAVGIIALVFTDSIAGSWLMLAGLGFVATWSLNRIGVRAVPAYLVVGAIIWLAFLKSGIHPTVAGVLLGLMTPASAWIGHATFLEVFTQKWNRLRNYTPPSDSDSETELPIDVHLLQFAARETISPLHRLEIGLHPWVAFGIMPLFALANAGVQLDPSAIGEPMALAVACGLALGKPLGILLFCFIAVQSGLTQFPEGVTWKLLSAGACLAGIGFTMALFINGLAFPGDAFASLETAGKIGILFGSLLSAVAGSALMFWAIPRTAASPPNEV